MSGFKAVKILTTSDTKLESFSNRKTVAPFSLSSAMLCVLICGGMVAKPCTKLVQPPYFKSTSPVGIPNQVIRKE